MTNEGGADVSEEVLAIGDWSNGMILPSTSSILGAIERGVCAGAQNHPASFPLELGAAQRARIRDKTFERTPEEALLPDPKKGRGARGGRGLA